MPALLSESDGDGDFHADSAVAAQTAANVVPPTGTNVVVPTGANTNTTAAAPTDAGPPAEPPRFQVQEYGPIEARARKQAQQTLAHCLL